MTLERLRQLLVRSLTQRRPVASGTTTFSLLRQEVPALELFRGLPESGAPVLPNLSRVTYDDAVKALKEHYKVTGARDLTEAGYRWPIWTATSRGAGSRPSARTTVKPMRSTGKGRGPATAASTASSRCSAGC